MKVIGVNFFETQCRWTTVTDVMDHRGQHQSSSSSSSSSSDWTSCSGRCRPRGRLLTYGSWRCPCPDVWCFCCWRCKAPGDGGDVISSTSSTISTAKVRSSDLRWARQLRRTAAGLRRVDLDCRSSSAVVLRRANSPGDDGGDESTAVVGDGGVGESATRGKLTPPGMRCSIGAVGDGSSRGILMTPYTAHTCSASIS